MAAGSHDTLVYRLAQMLVKLNQGESLDPSALADEFGVNLRTVQRDLNERFAYLPLEKSDGRYHLDPAFLGKLSTRDIERFASLAGVRGLFPSLSDEFLKDIFDARMQSALLVKGHHYEDLADRKEAFRSSSGRSWRDGTSRSSTARRRGPRHTRRWRPTSSSITRASGTWRARDGEKLKTFAFGKIERLKTLETTFAADPSVEKTLLDEDGIWLGEEKREIVMKISAEVAGYFKRRKLIANQVIEKTLEDGGLLVSAKVGHLNQVLPIVRYWIPHIRIISPEGLQGELDAELGRYLEGSA